MSWFKMPDESDKPYNKLATEASTFTDEEWKRVLDLAKESGVAEAAQHCNCDFCRDFREVGELERMWEL